MQIPSYLVVWGKGLRKTSYRSGSQPGKEIGSEKAAGRAFQRRPSLSKLWSWDKVWCEHERISSFSIYIRIKSDLNDFKPMEEIFLVN